MQAVHKACMDGRLNATVSHIISNDPSAEGLQYAKENNISVSVLDHREYPNRDHFDNALADTVAHSSPDLILLAGFMRRLGGPFTQRFESRLINIHPSLLPRHPGLHTHEKAISNGDRWHGCSIHYVTEELDGGPVIARSIVPVFSKTDTPDTLAARVLHKEHLLYWQVTRMCLERTVECQDGHIIYNGKKLLYPLLL